MTQCRAFPGITSPLLVENLAPIFQGVLGLNASPAIIVNLLQSQDTLVNLYCAAEWTGTCLGLCPNSDLAGPGVRYSFYIQSFLNAVLVAISPEDSPSACWSATLLTASIVIPAIIQKKEAQLTLHHASLVLALATLSAVSTLASAPFCKVWIESDSPDDLVSGGETDSSDDGDVEDDFSDEDSMQSSHVSISVHTPPGEVAPELRRRGRGARRPRPSLDGEAAVLMQKGSPVIIVAAEEHEAVTFDVPEDEPTDLEDERQRAEDFRRVKWASKGYRARVFLSLALLLQVSLQWVWAIFLFTSPFYSQEICNPDTRVVIFGAPLSTHLINQYPPLYLIWPAWLLACLGASLFWGVLLVFATSAPTEATTTEASGEHVIMSPGSPTSHLEAGFPFSVQPYIVTQGRRISNDWVVGRLVKWLHRALAVTDTKKRTTLWTNIAAICVCIFFVGVGETQVRSNCVFDENSTWGFGQISAILLAAVPVWPIVSAFHRDRAHKLKEQLDGQRRSARASRSQLQSRAPSQARHAPAGVEPFALALTLPTTPRATVAPQPGHSPSWHSNLTLFGGDVRPSGSRSSLGSPVIPATPLPRLGSAAFTTGEASSSPLIHLSFPWEDEGTTGSASNAVQPDGVSTSR